jgi:protein ImuA
MKLVSSNAGAIKKLVFQPDLAHFQTGSAWKTWQDHPANRAIHELLFDARADHPPPAFAALTLAQKAIGQSKNSRALLWLDPLGTCYPPAIAAAGIPPQNLYLLRPRPADLVWTAVECLRCTAVAAVVAMLPLRPTPVEVRRLQLAAESGGGVGILLRPIPKNPGADVYAAATRWLIQPAPGARTVQRWIIRLLHGQGGPVESFVLEKSRELAEANPVYPISALAHHAPAPAARAASS